MVEFPGNVPDLFFYSTQMIHTPVFAIDDNTTGKHRKRIHARRMVEFWIGLFLFSGLLFLDFSSMKKRKTHALTTFARKRTRAALAQAGSLRRASLRIGSPGQAAFGVPALAWRQAVPIRPVVATWTFDRVRNVSFGATTTILFTAITCPPERPQIVSHSAPRTVYPITGIMQRAARVGSLSPRRIMPRYGVHSVCVSFTFAAVYLCHALPAPNGRQNTPWSLQGRLSVNRLLQDGAVHTTHRPRQSSFRSCSLSQNTRET